MSAGELNAPSVEFSTDGSPLRILAEADRSLRDQQTGFRSTAVIEGRIFVAKEGHAGFCAENAFRVLMVAKELIGFSTSPVSDAAHNSVGGDKK